MLFVATGGGGLQQVSLEARAAGILSFRSGRDAALAALSEAVSGDLLRGLGGPVPVVERELKPHSCVWKTKAPVLFGFVHSESNFRRSSINQHNKQLWC